MFQNLVALAVDWRCGGFFDATLLEGILGGGEGKTGQNETTHIVAAQKRAGYCANIVHKTKGPTKNSPQGAGVVTWTAL